VAISTHRRPNILAAALSHWATLLPDVLVVNHDRTGHGVGATKNAGIAALMDAGCQHLFLADDDVWPVSVGWALHYIDAPSPHLMHCWGKSRYQNTQGPHTIWSWPRGVLLYATREVIDRVGGMRTDFGRVGGEHVEWSRRIHNAGLTEHPFQDAAAARTRVWHCEDYTRATPTSMPGRYTEKASAARHALLEKFAGSSEFVEYRLSQTCLTGSPLR
jgi:hypothetical protein